MNPLTNMRNVTKLSQRELDANSKTSWHDEYRNSAWIFVGGLPFDLTEGDILAVFSQYGEIVNLNLCRDKATGKSKGFCFICYENQKSTVLSVDNFNGIKILGRSIRVDHVKDYKPPKDSDKLDDITRMLHAQGCAPQAMEQMEKTIGGYELLEDEDDNEDYRDDGLGSHSVLKGFKDTTGIKTERESPRRSLADSTTDSQRNTIRDRNRERRSRSRSPRQEREATSSRHDREHSKKKHQSHSSSRKEKKAKHSKSKKDKKRKKHKKRKTSSSDDSSDDSDDSSSSENESSDDESHRKSKKHRRHKK